MLIANQVTLEEPDHYLIVFHRPNPTGGGPVYHSTLSCPYASRAKLLLRSAISPRLIRPIDQCGVCWDATRRAEHRFLERTHWGAWVGFVSPPTTVGQINARIDEANAV
jgi:hypothetical protein